MFNKHVIMSSAEYFTNDQPINPYYHPESIDKAVAIDEHADIKRALEQAGVVVTQVPAPSNSQDGVYTANWALVRGDTAVLARLPAARKAEESWARQQLESLGKKVIEVPNDWKFSGQGDALPCGNFLFCGSRYRSDPQAQAFVADTLGYELIQLQAAPQRDASGQEVTNASSGWPDSFYYDIDLALAIIRPPTPQSKGLIAYCPEAFTEDSRQTLEQFDAVDKIIVSEDEAKHGFACNMVSTGETVVMSAHAPQFKQELEDRGLRVLTPEVRELGKGGGYIRCTSLSFND